MPRTGPDLVVFDPAIVIDRATYADALLQPEGIDAVVVQGVIIQRNGEFVPGVAPGEAIRAPLHAPQDPEAQ